MSYGTSDSAVIPPTKTEVLNDQKVKHCFTFIVYNDVHYHISSVVIFSNGKINKQTERTDAPSGDRYQRNRYITGKEGGRKESERNNIPDSLAVSLIFLMQLRPKEDEGIGL